MSTLAIVIVIYLVIGAIFAAVAAIYNDKTFPEPDTILLLLILMVSWPVEAIYGIFQWWKGNIR